MNEDNCMYKVERRSIPRRVFLWWVLVWWAAAGALWGEWCGVSSFLFQLPLPGSSSWLQRNIFSGSLCTFHWIIPMTSSELLIIEVGTSRRPAPTANSNSLECWLGWYFCCGRFSIGTSCQAAWQQQPTALIVTEYSGYAQLQEGRQLINCSVNIEWRCSCPLSSGVRYRVLNVSLQVRV